MEYAILLECDETTKSEIEARDISYNIVCDSVFRYAKLLHYLYYILTQPYIGARNKRAISC